MYTYIPYYRPIQRRLAYCLPQAPVAAVTFKTSPCALLTIIERENGARPSIGKWPRPQGPVLFTITRWTNHNIYRFGPLTYRRCNCFGDTRAACRAASSRKSASQSWADSQPDACSVRGKQDAEQCPGSGALNPSNCTSLHSRNSNNLRIILYYKPMDSNRPSDEHTRHLWYCVIIVLL